MGPDPTRRQTSKPGHKDLVYGVAGGGLVFIPRRQAQALATVWDAIDASRTFGEFRSRVPRWRYEDLLRRLGYGPRPVDEPPPPLDEPFEGRDLGCVGDGDYPEWAAQEMLRWIPREILTAPYSTVLPSFLNGPCLQLDPAAEAEIVEAFRAAGFRCTRDEALVWRACGAGPQDEHLEDAEH